MTPDEVAAELCALPLARFTAERNARAKAARADGDPDLATRIAALAKPTVAAWVVDAIGREAPEDLERVLALGPALRAAQEDGDRDRLRELVAARRARLAEVVTAAADRAEAAGQRVGDGVREEVEQTLLAAIASPAAAAAVRSGRLVRALEADGLEMEDLAHVVAGDPPDVPEEEPHRRAPRHRAAGEHRHREVDHRAEERARALQRACDRAASTAERADEAEAEAQEAADAADALRQRLVAAERTRDEARDTAEEARREADEAAAEVDRLGSE